MRQIWRDGRANLPGAWISQRLSALLFYLHRYPPLLPLSTLQNMYLKWNLSYPSYFGWRFLRLQVGPAVVMTFTPPTTLFCTVLAALPVGTDVLLISSSFFLFTFAFWASTGSQREWFHLLWFRNSWSSLLPLYHPTSYFCALVSSLTPFHIQFCSPRSTICW